MKFFLMIQAICLISLAGIQPLYAQLNEKEIVCDLKSTIGDAAAAFYDNREAGFTKEQAAKSMELDEREVGSLDYEIIKMAVEQAYAGTPGETISKNIKQFCLQQSEDAVAEPDVPMSEFNKNSDPKVQREQADCEAKTVAMSEAMAEKHFGSSEAKIKKILSAIGDKTLESQIWEALNSSEEAYDRLYDKIIMQCGG